MKHCVAFNSSLTFFEVIRLMDVGGVGFLAFTGEETGRLVGVLTDGDVRRAILENEKKLDSIINASPDFMLESSSEEEVLARLKQLHRRHMPLVDENGILKRIFSLDELTFFSKDNVVVVMAGGLGSRLGEMTKHTPKPMLSVGDRPMLQHLVEQFRSHGFRKFVFCLNYKKEIVVDYFKNGNQLGVEIDYVFEDERMGTAGALGLIDKSMLSKPFFIVNADILTSLDFSSLLEFHISNNSVATMCVRRFEYEVPYGVVSSNEEFEIMKIEEKPQIEFNVNAGIYVAEPRALKIIPNNFYDMPSLFQDLIGLGEKCCSMELQDYWIDIGRVEDFKKANNDIRLPS